MQSRGPLEVLRHGVTGRAVDARKETDLARLDSRRKDQLVGKTCVPKRLSYQAFASSREALDKALLLGRVASSL